VFEYLKNLLNLTFLFFNNAYYDRKHWNHGICRASGKPWTITEIIGSDGSRLCVDSVGNYIWVKYNFVLYF
jgi:hypothetical protein